MILLSKQNAEALLNLDVKKESIYDIDHVRFKGNRVTATNGVAVLAFDTLGSSESEDTLFVTFEDLAAACKAHTSKTKDIEIGDGVIRVWSAKEKAIEFHDCIAKEKDWPRIEEIEASMQDREETTVILELKQLEKLLKAAKKAGVPDLHFAVASGKDPVKIKNIDNFAAVLMPITL